MVDFNPPSAVLKIGGTVATRSPFNSPPEATVQKGNEPTQFRGQSTTIQNQRTTPIQYAQMIAYYDNSKRVGTFGSKSNKKGGKNMKKKEKNDEKKENKEWDTGFGELYEKIDDRKKKPMFPSMEQMLEVD